MIDKYSQKEWGIDGLCEHWRKRREAYEQAVEEEHQLQHEAIEIEKREEILNTIAKRAKASLKKNLSVQYKQQETESQSSFSPVLLLPAVTNSVGNEDKQLSMLGINGIQKVGVQRVLQRLKVEKQSALRDACNYRNLAERLKRKHGTHEP